MFKKWTALIIVLVVALVPMTAKAATVYEVNMLCNEPLVDDNHGYVLCRYENGQYALLYWDAYCDSLSSETGNALVSVRINPTSIEFKVGADGTGFFGLYHVSQRNGMADEAILVNTAFTDSYTHTLNITSTILAYTHAGVYNMVDTLGEYRHSIVVSSWGGETLLYGEVKEANSWLEKILEAINGSSEQQKQEATNQGNSSVSQGESAIEDKGAAFGDGISALTSSMSYTGTECAWQFPQVKLPAINGVMDEVVLMESQPIDFAQWVNAIPSDILIVIQSLLTIGLIVYCFKELYSMIAYVLTLRKDDNA